MSASIKKLLALAALGVAATLSAMPASAGVGVSIGVNVPIAPGIRVSTVASNGYGYHRPGSLYYTSAPAYYAPAPVVYRPAPVVYAPIVVQPYPRPRHYHNHYNPYRPTVSIHGQVRGRL